MKINEVKNVNAFLENDVFQGKRLFDKEKAQIVHLIVKPGKQLEKHSAPVNVFFYVFEGEGFIEYENKKEKLHPDIFIDAPADIPHSIVNTSDKDLKILVCKIPRPIEK